MKRNVYTDGNGSSLIQVEGMGTYVTFSELKAAEEKIAQLQNDVLAKRIVELTNERDGLKAQIERLLESAKEAAEALGFASHHLRGRASENMLMDMAEKADELISAIGSTPAQCLAARDAEIKAQAVEALKFPTMLRKMWSGGEVRAWLKEEAQLIRQQVKGE